MEFFWIEKTMQKISVPLSVSFTSSVYLVRCEWRRCSHTYNTFEAELKFKVRPLVFLIPSKDTPILLCARFNIQNAKTVFKALPFPIFPTILILWRRFKIQKKGNKEQNMYFAYPTKYYWPIIDVHKLISTILFA